MNEQQIVERLVNTDLRETCRYVSIVANDESIDVLAVSHSKVNKWSIYVLLGVSFSTVLTLR